MTEPILPVQNPNTYSPLALAFLGDAVYGLLVREKLVLECNRPAGALHTLSIKQVNAAAQAKGAKKLLSVLTQEESDVFKRAGNCGKGDFAAVDRGRTVRIQARQKRPPRAYAEASVGRGLSRRHGVGVAVRLVVSAKSAGPPACAV